MREGILLYGSKARSDHERFSDTDLLGISSDATISKPFDQFGLSFHVYPKIWMMQEAQNGSLFLLHIVKEAKAIYDPQNILLDLRGEFRFKDSYLSDIELGCRVVSAALGVAEAEFTSRIRRRYFWGLRTALMAEAAQKRSPRFSAGSLEKSSGIEGLASHIQGRSDASFSECREMGERMLKHSSQYVGHFSPADRENLEVLLGRRGVGSVAAGEILYGFGPSLPNAATRPA